MGMLRRRLLLFVEGTSWTLGLLGLVWWGSFQFQAARSSRAEVARFEALQEAAARTGAAGAPAVPGMRVAPRTPDQSLWSAVRVAAWRKAVSEPAPPPLAVLRIKKIGLEVPVLRGTDEQTLDRAVGLIEYTAEPGTVGNLGIAGHRDGFFRGLKDIAVGDRIELDTLAGADVYRVERVWIVNPDDVSVLDPTPTAALTLVTCHPFYFSGSAPQRFIVRAVLEPAGLLATIE
jgi:sortase A